MLAILFYFMRLFSFSASSKPATTTRIVSVKEKRVRAKERETDSNHRRISRNRRDERQADGRRDLTKNWKEKKISRGMIQQPVL